MSESPKPRPRWDKLTVPEGVDFSSVTLKPTEDGDEKRQRLRQEMLSFWIKDFAVPIVAIVLVVSAGISSIHALWGDKAPREDRQFAMSLLSSTLTGVVAFLFGKAVK